MTGGGKGEVFGDESSEQHGRVLRASQTELLPTHTIGGGQKVPITMGLTTNVPKRCMKHKKSLLEDVS